MKIATRQTMPAVALPTALGTFEATFSDEGVRQLRFPNQSRGDARCADARARHLADELDAYLRGVLIAFSTPVDLQGTPFQLSVWYALREIPYGEVRSYAEIAEAIHRPSAVRAVGAANGANPVPVIVPCHRVIGSDGKLVGFGAGVDWKLRLLGIENAEPAGLFSRAQLA